MTDPNRTVPRTIRLYAHEWQQVDALADKLHRPVNRVFSYLARVVVKALPMTAAEMREEIDDCTKAARIKDRKNNP